MLHFIIMKAIYFRFVYIFLFMLDPQIFAYLRFVISYLHFYIVFLLWTFAQESGSKMQPVDALTESKHYLNYPTPAIISSHMHV